MRSNLQDLEHNAKEVLLSIPIGRDFGVVEWNAALVPGGICDCLEVVNSEGMR